MKRMKLVRWLSVVLASAFLLHGCSCRIPVTIRGSLGDGIVFRLDESREAKYVGMSMRGADGNWREIWRLEGEGDFAAIKYGEVPKGLTVAIAPQSLEKNRLYEFHVEEDTFWAPCVGSLLFVVNDDGSVEECGTPQCERKYL